jgi:ribonuclease HI
MKSDSSIIIYTDGGCEPNPGEGAWAWALDKETYDSGYVEKTTNNRMEMMAIIKAIEWIRAEQGIEDVVTIYSDSKYCVNGFMDWMHSWKRAGWWKKGGEIKNLDLWKILYENRNKAVLKWVPGHSGVEMNEFVDGLCNAELGIDPMDQKIGVSRNKLIDLVNEVWREFESQDAPEGKAIEIIERVL